MKPKKRILLVHNFYQLGGGEHTVFENEEKLLTQNGHEVFSYTRSNDELKKEKWKMLLLPLTTVWSMRTFFQVRRIIREQRIDVVHCHNTFPLISPSVYYAARSLRVPVIQTVHNFRFLCPNGLFYRNGGVCEQCVKDHSFLPALKNRCYRNSLIQTAVAVSMLKIHRWLGTYRKINYIMLTEFSREKFRSLLDIHADNIFLKPNFVFDCASALRPRHVKPKFIYAGRLDENKGIRSLLDMWPGLPEDYELHIYGEGSCREVCETAAATHRNIRFFGFSPRETVFADLCDAAALVFPSACYEGYPMIIAECLSLGRPVLAASLGNHGDLVSRARCGLTYEYGDSESFCAAATRIVADNARFSKNAQSYFENYLNDKRNYEMLSEIYDNAKHIR